MINDEPDHDDYVNEFTQTVIRDRKTLIPVEIFYKDNQGMLGRIDGPAFIRRDRNTGNLLEEKYMSNNSLRRKPEEGPAHRKWSADTGKLIYEAYCKGNIYERPDRKPAIIEYDAKTGEVTREVFFTLMGTVKRDKRYNPEEKGKSEKKLPFPEPGSL